MNAPEDFFVVVVVVVLFLLFFVVVVLFLLFLFYFCKMTPDLQKEICLPSISEISKTRL